MQMTVMTGPERRRRWPAEERRLIVEAACAPGAVVADVARRYDVCTGLIYKWRREVREGSSSFIPALLVEEPGGGAAVSVEPAIVVELPGGARVTIGARAPAALVSATLKTLAR